MMWILVLILFSGPYTIEQADSLGVFTNQAECLRELREAEKIQPRQTSLGCIPAKRPIFI